MSDEKTLLIDADQPGAKLAPLVDAVEGGDTRVRIMRHGKPVAELRGLAVAERPTPLAVHHELKALYIAEDAFAPATDDEWPEENR